MPHRAVWILTGTLILVGCGRHDPPDITPMAVATAPLPPASDSGRELTADQQVLQALNRLTFGPRQGDAVHVRQVGVDKWIAQQLSPNSIRDDQTDAFLAHFSTYSQSIEELVSTYPEPGKLRQQLKGSQLADSVTARMALDSLRRTRLRLGSDVEAARVARAPLSARQLNEVMTDFWENHFDI
jgi:hypothetical protein